MQLADMQTCSQGWLRQRYARRYAAGEQPRETSSHDDKRPGEFAPKEGGGSGTAVAEPPAATPEAPAKSSFAITHDEVARQSERLHGLAPKMMNDFPRLRNKVDAADLAQDALMSLTKSMKEKPPNSQGHYDGMAAEALHHQFLDAVRDVTGRKGREITHASQIPQVATEGGMKDAEIEDTGNYDLSRQTEFFHQAAGMLSPRHQQVIMDGPLGKKSDAEIAQEWGGVSTKTVQRARVEALSELEKHLLRIEEEHGV